MTVHEYNSDDWARRLDPEPGKAFSATGERERSAFGRDLDRIYHSGAFRRLQGKTQVVGPGEPDFFRTRLTHSLECAQIGAALARRTGANVDLVQSVCLVHDIGNPPFGHNGEDVLRELMEHFGGFEGNAQSFRVLTCLEAKFEPSGKPPLRFGLNLSRAVLSSVLKYPWQRFAPCPTVPKVDTSKKYSTYVDDADAFGFAHAGLEMGERRFEAELGEWADDVAYAVHDLGDGIRARFVNLHSLKSSEFERDAIARTAGEHYGLELGVSKDDFREALDVFLEEPFFSWAERPYEGSEAQKTQAMDMTSSLIEFFVTSVGRRTEFDPFHDKFDVPLAAKMRNRLLCAVTWRYVIARRELSSIQHGQRRIVADLFKVLFDMKRDDLRKLLPDQLSFQLDKAGHPKNKELHDNAKARCVCDHVAGMTDRYALRLRDRLVLGRGSVTDVL